MLIKDYKALITQGYFIKFPIIFRRHIRLTETKVYKWNAVIQRTAVGINTYFKYFKE